MICKQVTEMFPDYLLGSVDEAAKSEIEAHLISCASCKEEVESLRALWTKLGTLPVEQPSGALRPRFYAMLAAYQQGLQHAPLKPHLRDVVNGWLERWWPRQPAFQFAFALLFLIVGVFTGYRLNAPVAHESTEITALRNEVLNMREMVTLTLLRQQSPSERLQGVSWVQRSDRPNEELLSALLHTLNYDPNVNVRLAAVDALYFFVNQPSVRQGLIQSLSRQTSPLVQIALIDLIVELREKRATEALKELMATEKINNEVKLRAEWGIQQLL
ncbi:MAG: HEAT repeat domain-containing protein [bacterium]